MAERAPAVDPRRWMADATLAARLCLARLDEYRSGGSGLVSSVRTAEPLIALTFDDGPDEAGTTAALAALAAHGARATFFLLGGRARRHPRLVAQIAAAGHEVGLHGSDHRLTTRSAADQVAREVAAGVRELADLSSSPVRWYRPPYGQLTQELFELLRAEGVTTVFWTRGARDWEDVPRSVRVAATGRFARPGSIVLLHDGHADEADGAEPGPIPAVDIGELVDDVLADYARRGLRSVTLTELLATGRPRQRRHFAPTRLSPGPGRDPATS